MHLAICLLRHLYTHPGVNYLFQHGFLFFSGTVVAAFEVLWPVTTIHHQQLACSLHESDSLIPCLNYCLNEQETRTGTVTALPSFTRSLSVSHLSPSLFHFCSFSVSLTQFSFVFAAAFMIKYKPMTNQRGAVLFLINNNIYHDNNWKLITAHKVQTKFEIQAGVLFVAFSATVK